MVKRIGIRAIAVCLSAILFFSCFIVLGLDDTYAADSSTKTMNVFTIIKSGKYVYCASRGGIYRINIKNGKRKRLVKAEWAGCYYPYQIRLHKGYIYYKTEGGTECSLSRVKTNGKYKRYLGRSVDYVLDGYTIYYSTYNVEPYYEYNMKMSLNGNNKTSSSIIPKNVWKKTNPAANGYKITRKRYKGYVTEYLVKPSGKKFKICKYEDF